MLARAGCGDLAERNLLAYADTSGLNLKVISSGQVHTLFTPAAWNRPGRYRLPTDVTWSFPKPRFTENAWLLENF